MTSAFRMRQYRTHTHENCGDQCTSVAPTHTTVASQAERGHSLRLPWGRGGRGDGRAVTSVLKASSSCRTDFLKHRHLGAGVVEENHEAEGGWN
jgi:hypothetical protein